MCISQYLSMTSEGLIKDFLTEVINNPAESLPKIEEISKTERYKTDYEFRATIETTKGIALSIVGENSKALSLTKSLIDTASSLKLWELVARNWNTRGAIYLNLTMYEKAVECFHNVVKVEKKHGLLRVTASAYCNMGNIFSTCNIHDKACQFFDMALETLKKGGEKQVRYYSELQLYYSNLALAHIKMGNLSAVADYLRLIEEIGVEKAGFRVKNGYYFAKMIYHFKAGEYEEGKKTYFAAKNIVSEDNLFELYILVSNFLEICVQCNVRDELYEEELLKMEKLQETYHNLSNILIYNRLREYYINKGDVEKLRILTEKYVDFLEREFENLIQRQSGALISVDEIMSKEDDLEGMRNKNTELELVANEAIKHKNSLQKAYHQIDVINKLGKKITSTTKLNEVIELIYENMSENIPATVFILMVKNEEKEGTLDTVAYYEEGVLKSNVSVDLKMIQGLVAECYHKNKIISSYDEEYAQFFEEQKNLQDADMNSAIYLPLNVDDEIIGICSVQDKNRDAYTNENIEFLKELLPYLSIALNNAIRSKNLEKEIQSHLRTQEELKEANRRLERISALDELTQINGRRAFSGRWMKFIKEAHQTKKTLSIIMLDIDSFKLYNDNYGHLEGDEILKKVAEIFRDNVERKNGLAARFGGEEFIASCIGLSFEENMQLAEKIRSDIYELGIPHRLSSYRRVSASLGIFVTKKVSIERKNEFIREADNCLYQAKKLGRNRTIGKEE